MELSNTERLLFLNQFLILKKLDIENAEVYDRAIEVLGEGYDDEYEDIFSHNGLFRQTPISGKIREDTSDILEMFFDLQNSYSNLEDKTGISENDIKISGFDGNNEHDYLTYARYLIGHPENLQYRGFSVYDTHSPTVRNYENMLMEYRNVEDNLNITKDEMLKIVGARKSI